MKNANQVEKNQANQEINTPEAINCGNCWGHQEWDGDAIDKAEKAETGKDNFIQAVAKKVLK